jgi:hypothetical protein
MSWGASIVVALVLVAALYGSTIGSIYWLKRYPELQTAHPRLVFMSQLTIPILLLFIAAYLFEVRL